MTAPEQPRNLEDSDDSLDRLLQSARWPEPNPDQVERLAQRWQFLRRGRATSNHSAWLFAALAAGLLVATAAASWRWIGAENMASAPQESKERRNNTPAANDGLANSEPQRVRRNPLATRQETGPRSPALPKREGSEADRPAFYAAPVVASGSSTDELTCYEQVAWFAVLEHRERRRASAQPRSEPLDLQPLNAALASLASTIKVEGAGQGTARSTRKPLVWRAATVAAAGKLAPHAERYEPALITIIQTTAKTPADRAHKLAATCLLAQIGTPRSFLLLSQLLASPELHEGALFGVARWATADQLDSLIVAEQQPGLQRWLLTSLLERGDSTSLTSYLHFVGDHNWGRAALEAARQATYAPVEELFACLEGPQVSLRETAAKTLANLPDPRVWERLAEHVRQNVSRREALVGLLSSPYPQAADFVQAAKEDQYLMATVQAVESEIPWFTEYPRR